MDSAGTMHPADAGAYVEALKARVKIPVGFTATATWVPAPPTPWLRRSTGRTSWTAACWAWPSAGNMPTELAVALMHQQGRPWTWTCTSCWSLRIRADSRHGEGGLSRPPEAQGPDSGL